MKIKLLKTILFLNLSYIEMSDELTELDRSLKGKDESKVREITLRHTNSERLQIRENYKEKFGQDLLNIIDKYMHKDFKNALIPLYKEPSEYDADLFYKAMKGIGSDKDLITELICFRSFDKLNKIKIKFKEKYKKELISEIKSETSGDYQKAIIFLLENERKKNVNPNLENCKMIAEELYNAGENKIGTNEAVFIKYFTSLSVEELQLVSKEYHKNYKKTIVQVIDNEFGGVLRNLLKCILYGLYSPSEYFARKIYDAVDGIGTSDDQLIRCIITRCEEDMKYIKRYFKQIYKTDMIEKVKDDTSGEYQKLLEGLMLKK